MTFKLWLTGLVAGAGWLLPAAPAGAAAGKAPPKIVPATEAEIKAELDKETPEQKKLREELSALAKAGGLVYFNANCAGNNDVYVTACDGSNLRQLTRDPAEDVYPHCSPDGRTVVFTSMRLPLAQPLPEALKGVPFDPRYPLDSPRSKERFLIKEGANMPAAESRGSAIWSMKPDGSDQKPLAFGLMPHWSPDGRFLVYNAWRYQLAVMDVEKKTESLIAHPGLRNCGFPCFSPDGGHVLGNGGTSYCVTLNAEKNAVEKVASFEGGHTCNGEISPDGKSWAFVVDTNGALGGWLSWKPMDVEKPGGAAKRLELGWKPGSVNYFPCFSPDSKYLVYSHGDQQAGIKSWMLSDRQDLYVTRFPGCEATVRLTWTNAACQHPHWWGPPARSR
jgi:Tol biopolymer transport system component